MVSQVFDQSFQGCTSSHTNTEYNRSRSGSQLRSWSHQIWWVHHVLERKLQWSYLSSRYNRSHPKKSRLRSKNLQLFYFGCDRNFFGLWQWNQRRRGRMRLWDELRYLPRSMLLSVKYFIRRFDFKCIRYSLSSTFATQMFPAIQVRIQYWKMDILRQKMQWAFYGVKWSKLEAFLDISELI